MKRTALIRFLKHGTTESPTLNFLQKQERFDDSIEVYNQQRPHQALDGEYPAQLYTPSPRPYQPPEEPDYPYHDRTVRMTHCGRICIGKRKVSLSRAFGNQVVGIREVADPIWLVSFLTYDLGFFDQDEARVDPASNPFIITPEKV